MKGDSNRKKSGRPRFKGKGRYRSLVFPDPIKPEHLTGKFIQLPKIGKVKMILHRSIPDGFKIKTATITCKADGWYISLSLKDVTVPSTTDAGWGQFLQILNTKAASAGCLVVAVNSNSTSQQCSDCGATVSKTLADRWHSCQCGASYCRDHNAARNVKYRAAGQSRPFKS